MRKCLLLGVVLVMLGCGGDVNPPETSTAADIRDRTLKRLKVLEQQAAKDDVQAKDVRDLSVSLRYLIGHLEREKVGSDEQIQTLTTLHQALVETGGGAPGPPPRDWRPDSGQTAPEARLDAQPIRDLLPRIRKALEAVPVPK